MNPLVAGDPFTLAVRRIAENDCVFHLFQARGPKKHLKRFSAPKHWMLDKLSGRYVSLSSRSRVRELVYKMVLLMSKGAETVNRAPQVERMHSAHRVPEE